MNPKKTYLSNISASNNFGAPSSAWQAYGATKKLSPDGAVLMNKKPVEKVTPTPSNVSGTPATYKPPTPTTQNRQTYLEGLMKQAKYLESQIPTATGLTKKDEYKDTPEYKTYLKWQREKENPSEASDYRKQYESSLQRLADVQSERETRADEIRREQRDALDASGGLKRGALDTASTIGRRGEDELARIALQESAAARSAGVALSAYQPYQDIETENRKPLSYEEAQSLGVPYGTTIGEARELGIIPSAPTPEGYTLSEGQARYEYNPATGQMEMSAQRGKTYAPTSGGGSATTGYIGADGKPLKLLAGQVDTIANYDNTLNAAQRALDLLAEGVSTGPVSNLMLQGKKFSGYGNEKQLQMEQLLGKIRADFMKAISGAAVSEQEVKRLSKFLPDLGDQENVIKSKLTNLLTEIESSKNVYLSTIGGSQSQPSVSSPQQMQLPDGTIVTLQPDGTYQ